MKRVSNQSFKQGIFKEELKNRFLCLVEVDGNDTLCYIPSSCRFSNFLDMKGKMVLLRPVLSKTSRTKYSVYALFNGKKFILLDMSKANDIIRHNIKSRRFAILGKRNCIKNEVTIDGYKSDIYIEDTNTIIEIKCVLSFDSEAVFPSIYSQRAIEQMTKLYELLLKGYNVTYFFVSLNPVVKRISINKKNTKYWDAFNLCVEKGMKYKGVSINLIDDKPVIHKNIDIEI